MGITWKQAEAIAPSRQEWHRIVGHGLGQSQGQRPPVSNIRQ